MTLIESVSPGTGTFPSFLSLNLIDLLATLTLVIVLAGILVRYAHFRRSSPQKFFSVALSSLGLGKIVRVFVSELVNRVLLQRNLINDKGRVFTHICMFWGFVGLALTTTSDYIFNQPGNYIALFGDSLSWIRWLGNTSGAIMLLGATIAIGRIFFVPKFRKGRYFWDVWFTSLLFCAGATGFVTEYLGDIAHAASPNIPPAANFTISLAANPLIVVPYGIHIAAIGLLFITAPVSMFMHALTVPSLRLIDRLGILLTIKNKSFSNEHRLAKHQTMSDGIKNMYEVHLDDEEDKSRNN